MGRSRTALVKHIKGLLRADGCPVENIAFLHLGSQKVLTSPNLEHIPFKMLHILKIAFVWDKIKEKGGLLWITKLKLLISRGDINL